MRTQSWPTRLPVLAAYLLFALALTWPLAAHFSSHVPGNGADDPPLTWNLWWVQHALLQLGANPFDCDYLFYPLGINLAFYTLTELNGLLAYVFYIGALVLVLGRPWNVINPIIGNSFGYNSVLFQVSRSFLLYILTEAVEFSPAVAEWLRLKRLRNFLRSLTLGAVILGVTLSTLHQAGLGALFLIAKPKIHPLWYTEFIPVLFTVSSVYAGLSRSTAVWRAH